MNNNIENNNMQNLNNNYQIPQQPINPQPQTTNQEPNKNNKKGLIIGIVIALIIIITIISIILVPKLLKDDNNTNNNESNNNVSNNENKPSSNKEITLEALMNTPESPEEDFDVSIDGNGEVVLDLYLGDDEIVVIPESLGITEISSYVFGYKSPVKAIKLADSIKVLEPRVFATNEVLEIFVAGKGLQEMGEATFQSCANLKEVILNKGLETIYGLSFTNCDNLKSLEIPETVTNIQTGAFYSTSKDFTVIGTPGSAAERAATEDGVKFQVK